MIYLGQPYTSPDPTVMQSRFLSAQTTVIQYAKQGIHLFSPIVLWHEAAIVGDLPKDFTFWRTMNLDMLRRADALWILTLPGWANSRGLAEETILAETLGIPTKRI